MDQNWGCCAPFFGEGEMRPILTQCGLGRGLPPGSTPSFILMHSTVWPQYTNVTDRQTENGAIAPVLQTIAQKLKSGLVASYDTQPGNGEGLCWFRHFINLSLTHLLRHLPTYLSPGPTRGRDTINWSGRNLAWKRTPRAYFWVLKLALIWEGVGTGAPKIQCWVKIAVFRSTGVTVYINRGAIWHGTIFRGFTLTPKCKISSVTQYFSGLSPCKWWQYLLIRYKI